jgi:HEPN domain-containing protein
MTTPLPDPGELGVEGYSEMSRRFLEHAKIELDKGDRIQAAEKVWGAAAHALKAAGEQRGWTHDRHPNIFDIGEHLGREFGREDEFNRYLAQAEYMHRNFYQNGWSEGAIRTALFDVERLTQELETIRNSAPRTFTVRDNDDRIRLRRLLGLQRADRPAIGEYSAVGYSQAHPVDINS